MPVIPISNVSDRRLDDYRGVRDGAWLRERGLFIAEGRFILRTLLDPPDAPLPPRFDLRSVLLSEPARDELADALVRAPSNLPVYVCSRETIEAVAGFDVHRGCLGAGAVGEPLDWHALLDPRPARVLVLDELTNHDNVGGVFRSAHAFGFTPVLLHQRCADPLYRKSIRVSMGSVLRVPSARTPDWPTLLDRFDAIGYQTVALTPDADAPMIQNVSETPERLALIVGSEGPGLPTSVLQRVTTRARILMTPGIDSLNTVVAASIAMQRFAGTLAP